MTVRSSGNPRASFRDRFLGTGSRASRPYIPPFSATGGNMIPSATTGNGYIYHVFVASGSFIASGSPKNVEYLVIAGGGGGGFGGASGGGGGAGGFKTNVPGHPYAATALPLGAGSYPVTVGAGGAGKAPGNYNTPPAQPGGDGIDSTFHTITATAGGGGGSDSSAGAPTTGRDGGSAGGGGNNGGSPSTGGTASPPGQGNPGGNGSASHRCYAAGGGGGAGGSGSTSSPGVPAPGGNGSPIPAFAYPIIQPGIPVPMQPTFGPAVGPTGLYAAGGGGGVYNWDPRNGGLNCFPGGGGSGGSGGGGTGGAGTNYVPSSSPFVLATNAVNGTGSGGGGSGGVGGGNPGNAGNGGDGIVIVRYLA
jgi:hypothetical protein